MDIIPGILSEEEVPDMPSEALLCFAKLFDTTLNNYIREYYESPQRKPEVVEKLQRSIGKVTESATFHTQVHERGIRTLLSQNSMRDLPMMAYNGDAHLDKVIEELQWLLANEGKLSATVSARTTSDFDAALGALTAYQADRTKAHQHNLPKILKENKTTLFCPPREKASNTGMRGLITNKSQWTMTLKAAQYLDLCLKNGISFSVMREC